MVAVNSTMLPLGTIAPNFELPDTDGNLVSIDRLDSASAYVIMFICNHCPYVKMLRKAFAALANDYQSRGVAIIAINSNDFEKYPDDSPEKMKAEVKAHGYSFPYLVDADQSVAKKYKAACTPDFYVFNKHKKLFYRGQFDDSRPGNDVPSSGKDLRKALDAALENSAVPEEMQTPSIGCNIKWKPGNEPDYFLNR